MSGEYAVFFARGRYRDCQLWMSYAGSVVDRAFDLSPGAPLSSVEGRSIAGSNNGRFYFMAADQFGAGSLWVSNGFFNGTSALKTFAGGARPRDIISADGYAFVAVTGGTDRGLWKSDGTSVGTQRLLDAEVRDLAIVGGQVFFQSDFPTRGLWRTDGTPAGTIQLFSLSSSSSFSSILQPALTQLFFVVGDSSTGSSRIWRSDGTLAGTRIAWDQDALDIKGTLGDVAIFSGFKSGDYGLWRTDGTPAGTQKLISQLPGQSRGEVLDGRLFFTYGGDLWRTDGTAAGTLMVADNVMVCCSDTLMKAAGGSLFLFGQDNANGLELRVTSGSVGPVTLVDDLEPGRAGISFDSGTPSPVAFAGGLFFRAASGVEGNEPRFLPFDRTPDPYSFASKTSVNARSTVISDPVQVTGINAPAFASVAPGELCVSSAATCACDVKPFAQSQQVGINQYVCVRHVANATIGGSTTSTISIGGVDSTFTSTTTYELAVVQFSQNEYFVTEGQPSITLTVNRTGPADLAASVNWSITFSDAAAGVDYTGPANGVLTWGAGDAAPKSIVIPIVDNALAEQTRTLVVELSAPVNLTLGTPTGTVVRIADNDSGVFLAPSDYRVAESGGSIAVQVMRVGNTTRASVSVHWTAVNGTAEAGKDYGKAGSSVAPSGQLTWSGSDLTPKFITIPILQDAESEGPETFTIVLSSPVGTTLGWPTVATVTITDDDIPVESRISFSQPKYLVLENAASAVLTVRREAIGGGFTVGASVNYATQPGTALASSDYTTRTGSVSWVGSDATDKTITVPIVNDTVAEPDESFKVALTTPSAGVQIATSEATVVIVDDNEHFPPAGAIPSDWVVPVGADAGWHVSNEPGAFEGVFSLRSDAIGDGQKAQVEVTRNFGAGNVAFRVRVSSEPVFDRLRFFVDGVEKGAWSGTATTGWTLFTTPVTAGTHTLRWSYEKDSAISVGSDAAWIDAVTLP